MMHGSCFGAKKLSAGTVAVSWYGLVQKLVTAAIDVMNAWVLADMVQLKC